MNEVWFESDLKVQDFLFFLLLLFIASGLFYILLCFFLYAVKCQIEERDC